MTPELYSAEWHRGRSKYRPFAERALLALFALEGIPDSMLDVGCGPGWLVHLADRIGVNAFGVDVSIDPRGGDIGNVLHRDLTQPLELGDHRPRTFELVVTWEVAEHLPPESADTFVESVARHAGKLLVWTAAQPGQGGDGHLNEAAPYVWREKLKLHGLAYDDRATHRLREIWRDVVGPAWWYSRNALVLRRPA